MLRVSLNISYSIPWSDSFQASAFSHLAEIITESLRKQSVLFFPEVYNIFNSSSIRQQEGNAKT